MKVQASPSAIMEATALTLVTRLQRWLRDNQAADNATYCDKQRLEAEMHAQMSNADKKQRKAITKEFDERRKHMQQDMQKTAHEALPALRESLLALLDESRPLLQRAERQCRARIADLAAMPVEKRGEACRIFYDGTSDDAYSNFKGHRFAIGRIGFLKGEQFFHTAKAILCGDFESAVGMVTTTGGPALRSLGREVTGYTERGQLWEDVDSGLVLLVCILIKVAQLDEADVLRAEMQGDGADLARGSLVYIAEGAKDDARCGIGIHADEANVLERLDAWGRNQLGHASIIVAVAVHAAANAPAAAPATANTPAAQVVTQDSHAAQPSSAAATPKPPEASMAPPSVAEEMLFELEAGDEDDTSPWTHYLVLDFEATCAENDPTQRQWSELIEFPCVLVDARSHATVAEFRSMVRPTQRPTLTAFCTHLTSITQDQVATAPTLDEVLRRFGAWLPNVLGTDDTSRVLPVTCGEPDLASMLPRECQRKGLQVPSVLQRYCNIKKPFSGLMATKAGGMTAMLQKLNLPLQGHHHLGIDDARNIARIVVKLASLGATIGVTGVAGSR